MHHQNTLTFTFTFGLFFFFSNVTRRPLIYYASHLQDDRLSTPHGFSLLPIKQAAQTHIEHEQALSYVTDFPKVGNQQA